MRKTLFTVMAAIAALASCQKNEITQIPEHPVITAHMEQVDATRTIMDEDNNIRWSEGDQIVAFLKTSLGRRYQVQSSYVGETFAAFDDVSGTSGTITAGTELSHNVAYYPYASAITCEKSGTDYVLNVTLPSEQTYMPGSFGSGSFPMTAVSETNDITFRNICGGMKLQLKGTQKLASVKIEGKNSEKLSGAAVITAYTDGTKPSIRMASDASASVTLDCGEGVQLNENTATEFIISIPPVVFSKGFTATVTDTEGYAQTIETDKSNEVKRSSLLVMPEVTVEIVRIQSNNEIWYTASQKVEPVTDQGFGATIVSNEWDSSTKEGIITFDGDVTSIPEHAFDEKRSIKTIRLPETVTSIGQYAFYNCRSLKSVNIPSQVTQIPYVAFYYCYSLSSIDLHCITSVGNQAFKNCSELTSIDLSNVQEISADAFQNCTNLSDVTLPDDLTNVEIGWKPFDNCSLPVIDGVRYADTYLTEFVGNMSSYNVKDGTQVIGMYAFGEEGNTSVVTVNLPNTIVRIEQGAFYDCSALTSVNIPNGVKVIESVAFYNTAIKNVVLPESLIDLDNAFASSAIESIVFPNSLTQIPGQVCYFCKNLTSVTLGDKVTHIYGGAFSGCSKLTTITLPKTITHIYSSALDASNLNMIYCKATVPPAVYYFKNNYGTVFECFNVNSNLKIYVPRSAYGEYTKYTASTNGQTPIIENWYHYKKYVYEYDF